MKRNDRKASREAMGVQAAQARTPATRQPMDQRQDQPSQNRGASRGTAKGRRQQRYDRPG